MLAPERRSLLSIERCTVGSAFSRFKEAQPLCHELSTLPRETTRLGKVGDLVDVSKTRFIETILALAERTTQGPGRRKRTVVANRCVTRSEIKDALGSGVVDIQVVV